MIVGRKKGHRVSEETRKKISESGKGRIPWNKGKKGYKVKTMSIETKKKISKSLKGRKLSDETKKKLSKLQKGKKQSEGTLLKRSIAMKRYIKNENPNHLFKKGNFPWNYVDGRSRLRGPSIYGDDWEEIRFKIYKRDKYKCQKCGISMNECNKKYNVSLHVHHKRLFRVSKDNSLSNLITLCPSCHGKEDAKIFKDIRRLSR